MIKINLTPTEELENPLWFVPDVAFAVFVCAIAYLGVHYYIDTQQSVKMDIMVQTDKLISDANALEKDIKRLEDASKEINVTNEKLTEIKPLSNTEVAHYIPVIVIEHLQNLKPEGLWFKELNFGAEKAKKEFETTTLEETGSVKTDVTAGTPVAITPASAITDLSKVTITGFAFDNLLIAEFLTGLRATQTQEIDASDVRTLVYFSEVTLISSESKPTASAFNGVATSNARNPDEDTVYEFTIVLKFARSEVATGVTALTSQADFPVNTNVQVAER